MDKGEKWVEDKKRHAGAKVPSMKRRSDFNDYSGRNIYFLTLVVKGRRPLLGEVKGNSKAPIFVPSELGLAVQASWKRIPEFHPEIKLIAMQLMPDHLHGILQVTQKMNCHLGQVVNGFKVGCNKAYRKIIVEAMPQPTENRGENRHNKAGNVLSQDEALPRQQQPGLLFELGYNDIINKNYDMLPRLISYLRGNPRRLMMRREQPELFRVRFNQEVAGHRCSMLGNRFLLERPDIRAVQCSRRLTEEEIARAAHNAVEAAQHGAVHVSPAISAGEKAVMRALLDAGMPLIFLAENGLTRYSKPGGELFEACTRGQLLIIAPWEHHNEHIAITRQQCLALNRLSAAIASSN